MQIELWELGRLRPYEQNPRVNDKAVEAVARSIREFGFRVPIVVDAEGVIICGHTRLKAAQKLGLKQVPVHVATDLSPVQVKAYRLADNATADLAQWNYELLPIELESLRDLDYDITTLGFSEKELAQILDGGVKEGLCDPDEVPEPPDEPITRPGPWSTSQR
jgi:ParB-like chromosome segregation protein Spo0J